MSQPIYGHTQSGLTVCGGLVEGSSSNCTKFQSGSWTSLTDSLLFERFDHSSWVIPDGGILLIGGWLSTGYTTEIVDQRGNSIRSFDLKYETT